jgi:hypothetical protein
MVMQSPSEGLVNRDTENLRWAVLMLNHRAEGEALVVFEPNTTSAEPSWFYSIYSEQTIAEAFAVVECIQVCSKWSKC